MPKPACLWRQWQAHHGPSLCMRKISLVRWFWEFLPPENILKSNYWRAHRAYADVNIFKHLNIFIEKSWLICLWYLLAHNICATFHIAWMNEWMKSHLFFGFVCNDEINDKNFVEICHRTPVHSRMRLVAIHLHLTNSVGHFFGSTFSQETLKFCMI